jgi:NADH-quinone oxidoreductase subunit K
MNLEHVVALGIVLFAIGARGSSSLQHPRASPVRGADAQRREPDPRRLSRYLHGTEGQVFVFMIMTVAAAEAAVGLAILVALYRLLGTLDMSRSTS